MKKSAQGFTLIEVILAITILATLSMLVGTSLSRALKSKRKIQTEIEDVSTLRDAMRLIKNDINLAYNHYDFETDILKESQKTGNQQQGGGAAGGGFGGVGGNPAGGFQQGGFQQGTNPNSKKRENTRVTPATEFNGTETEINFITMNNGRINTSDLQADFIEVGYSLKGCTSLVEEKKQESGQCLYRRQQKVLDSDVTKGGTETVLLEGVTDFKLKYMGAGKLDWNSEWKTKTEFPEAVEVTLEIERKFEGKEKKYSLQYIIPLHFPNNQKNTQTTNTGGTSSSSSSSGGLITQ